MTIAELKEVLKNAEAIEKYGGNNAEVVFSSDPEGNSLYNVAHLMPTELENGETVFVFYPDNRSLI